MASWISTPWTDRRKSLAPNEPNGNLGKKALRSGEGVDAPTAAGPDSGITPFPNVRPPLMLGDEGWDAAEAWRMASGDRKLVRLGLLMALLAMAPDAGRDPTIGRSYKVPYRATETNHALVRVRVNGKGPFNFLVDTGAPALYVGTKAAKEVGLEPSKSGYWTTVDRLDFEGGPSLAKIQGRVEDPFQLVGMNALGLPGAAIDGILGYSVLARFRIELDPTTDRMTWTRLDFNPRMPFVPRMKEGEGVPAEVRAMDAIGPLAKFAALMVGKQPEDQLHPRGYLGLELAGNEPGRDGVAVARVLEGSPAARGGVSAGDRLLTLGGRDVKDRQAAHKAVAEVRPGDRVPARVRRGAEELDLTLTAGDGL